MLRERQNLQKQVICHIMRSTMVSRQRSFSILPNSQARESQINWAKRTKAVLKVILPIYHIFPAARMKVVASSAGA